MDSLKMMKQCYSTINRHLIISPMHSMAKDIPIAGACLQSLPPFSKKFKLPYLHGYLSLYKRNIFNIKIHMLYAFHKSNIVQILFANP